MENYLREFTIHFNDDNQTSFIVGYDGQSMVCLTEDSKDDNITSVIFNLHVSQKSRKQGIGTEIMKYVLNVAKVSKHKTVGLEVKTGSWMEQWYKRRFGFIDYSESTRKGYKWLVKLCKDRSDEV